MIVDWLQGKALQYVVLQDIWKEILVLLQIVRVRVLHLYREVNYVAIVLQNMELEVFQLGTLIQGVLQG